MSKLHSVLIAFLVLIVTPYPTAGADTTVRTMTCAFDNPSRPGTILVQSGNGNITVRGYSGSDVKIKATADDEDALPPEENEKAKGMKRIAGSGFNIATDRENNTIIINRSVNDTTDLEIQAPFNTSIKIGGSQANTGYGVNPVQNIVMNSMKIAFDFSGILEGTITIDGISGEIEASTLDGDIELKNVSGAVVANTMDGSINATFKSVPGKRPMAFSTMDGDIDVTLPGSSKATITAKTVDGDIFTDFDFEIIPEKVEPQKPSNDLLSGFILGMYGTTVTGSINGGGAEIMMKTVDGGVYIRKAK